MGFKLFPDDIKHWKVVVVSFLTATTFWFFNSLNKDYTTTLDYPVQFEFNSDSLIAVKKLPQSIELDVSGGGWSLLRKTAIFRPQPLKIDAGALRGKSSLSWLEVLPSIREQISDLNINQILGDTLNIQIEPLAEKWLKPIVDSVAVILRNNHRIISKISIQQDSVLLIGPQSYLDTLGNTFTIALPQMNIDEAFDESVKVVSSGKLLSATPETINVRFDVGRFNTVSLDVPLEKTNFPADSSFVLAQETIRVDFLVEEAKQQTYSATDFVIMADFNMLRSSDSSVLAILTAYPLEALDVKLTPEIIKVIPNE